MSAFTDDEVMSGTLVKAAERFAIERMGLSSLRLMELAAAAVSREIQARFDKNVSILIVCGVGNNGADGLCVARQLKEADYHPKVMVCGSLRKASPEFMRQLADFTALSGSVGYYLPGTALPETELLVDALFGIGLHGEIRGEQRALLEALGGLVRKFTLAVDLPSGLDADSGDCLGPALPADLTVSFSRVKSGMLAGSGPQLCGEIVLCDIGIPAEAWKYALQEGKDGK